MLNFLVTQNLTIIVISNAYISCDLYTFDTYTILHNASSWLLFGAKLVKLHPLFKLSPVLLSAFELFIINLADEVSEQIESGLRASKHARVHAISISSVQQHLLEYQLLTNSNVILCMV